MTGPEIKAPTDVPFENATKISVDWLKLDRENPRLVGMPPVASDESIIAQLYRREELGELLQSISANGYLDIEPLIVWLDSDEDDKKFIVLEGNRRLAAIRLFREPSLVDSIAKTEHLKIRIPEINSEVSESLKKISIYRVHNRNAARSFIGFKHINGAAKWESYAKARFAAEWYRSEDVTLEDIAEKIGDQHATIKRMVSAIYVLDQAQKEEVFLLSDRMTAKFNFSHLYTALSRTSYMKFLGLEIKWIQYDLKPNPVPDNKLGQLREVLVWIYGSKEDNKDPIIQSQNPDIKNLGEVLESEEGLYTLREGGGLAEAQLSASPADQALSASLFRARSEIREASHRLRGYDGSNEVLLNVAEDISETSQSIHKRMKEKFDSFSLKGD